MVRKERAMDTVVSLLIGVSLFGLPGLVGGVLVGIAFRPTRGAQVALGGVGLALAVALFVAAYLRAPSGGPPEGCSDCGEYLGRWWEPWVVVTLLLANLVGWLAGMFAGTMVRQTRST